MLRIILIVPLIVLLLSCAESNDLIGMNREQILKVVEKHPRFKVDNIPRFVICVDSSFHYYDTIDAIKKDYRTMKNSHWEILWEETFRGKRGVKITFKDDIVISQKNVFLNDGP